VSESWLHLKTRKLNGGKVINKKERHIEQVRPIDHFLFLFTFCVVLTLKIENLKSLMMNINIALI